MLFPGSRIWYEGTAADLASLTEEIKTSGFTGHVVLEFQDSIDVVVCIGGEFLKVIEKVGRRLLSTKKYREIWGKCQIKPGRMMIFELPPALGRRLRGLQGRRLLCSGTAATGCDPAQVLRDLKAAGFSGIMDCVAPEGKLLLDFDAGVVTGCYYSEYEGLCYEEIEAFRAWHRGFARASHPCFFFATEVGGTVEGQLWDEILMDYADQVPLPLPSSLERLARTLGRESAPGEVLFAAGSSPGRAYYLLSGEVELLPVGAVGGVSALTPGSLIGLGWLHGMAPAQVTGRARVASRYLEIDGAALPMVLNNSPALAARLLREAAGGLVALRTRLDAYRAEPRLRDMESAIAQVLTRHARADRGGVPATELFRELTQCLPLSLQEIDALFRRLVALGGVAQAAGRVALTPREF